MRRRYPTWSEALEAGEAGVEEAIRVGGLARVKSRVIVAILERLRVAGDGLTLDRLRRMPVEEARAHLRSFKGVGEKTACCVLLFACGRPAFPVDTHILRVTKRLGWVPARAGADRAHAILAGMIPPDLMLTGHVNLITLGRRLCRPRQPRCPACPLRPICAHASRLNSSRDI